MLTDIDVRGIAAIAKLVWSLKVRFKSSPLSERTTLELRGRNFLGSGSRLSRFCFFFGLGGRPRWRLQKKNWRAHC